MGQDGHDRGAKVIASAFSDAGFDIDIAPMFSTPKEVCHKQLITMFISLALAQAAGHKTLIPELLNELKKSNVSDIKVIAGESFPKKTTMSSIMLV